MARARSSAALADLQKKAGTDFSTQLVFAARRLELNPSDVTAANGLFDLLPKYEVDPGEEDPIRSAWLDLAGLQACASGEIPDRDLKPLFLLQDRLPRLVVRAVLVSPGRLPELLARTQLFITPESDFTIQMQTLCRKRHQPFVNAVNGLSPRDKLWFENQIFNPTSCRAIYLPEE